jgi:hypothetical protein
LIRWKADRKVMAVLKVVSLSENELILSTPSLKDITVANIISILVLSGIVILGGLFLKKTEYDSLRKWFLSRLSG